MPKDHPTLALRFTDDELELFPSYLGRPDGSPPRPEVAEAVNRLEYPLRDIVEAVYWEQITRVEVGHRLGVSVRSVKRYEEMALERLREALDAD